MWLFGGKVGSSMKNGVLIADDSAFMRLMLKDILKEEDIPVAGEAVNGNDAVEKFTSLEPDVTILDIAMPGTDGIKALNEIKKIKPDAVVVICTSMGHESIVKEVINAGADDYIVKPFHSEKIKNTIKRALNK